jgi:hypothetical protein
MSHTINATHSDDTLSLAPAVISKTHPSEGTSTTALGEDSDGRV